MRALITLLAIIGSLALAARPAAACIDKGTAANVIAIRTDKQPLAGVLGPPVGQIAGFFGGFYESFADDDGQYWLDGCNDLQVGLGGAISGATQDHYRYLGFSLSPLRFPVTNRTAIANGFVTYFEGANTNGARGGAIYENVDTQVSELHGDNFLQYVAYGETASVFGWPESDTGACEYDGICDPNTTTETYMNYGYIESSPSIGPYHTRQAWGMLNIETVPSDITLTYANLSLTASGHGFPQGEITVSLNTPMYGRLSQQVYVFGAGTWSVTWNYIDTGGYTVPGRFQPNTEIATVQVDTPQGFQLASKRIL